jgi:IS30 family transposase
VLVVECVAPEAFWVELRAGATVMAASEAVGVSGWSGYRWLHGVGGPDAAGMPRRGRGRPWGGRASDAVRDVFWAELRLGVTVVAAARAAGVARETGQVWLREAGGVRPRVVNPDLEAATTPGSGVLVFLDRCRIEELTRAGYCPGRIAALLGRARSTITRELGKGVKNRSRYRAVTAQACVDANRARAGRRVKLVPGRLFTEVVERLAKRHSPVQVAGRLRQDFPDDPEMWVSHETIYQALYVRPKGELATQVGEALRTGRTRRKPQGRQPHPKFKSGMVNISERPAEAEDRAVPGHWEGDLIIGANSRSAIGTLVERSSGFVLLLHLPGDHTAATVAEAMSTTIATLPAQLRRSMTWDQGSEMALHTKITSQTGMLIYFCDPHSPWQRGTNENTNGLLRQYFPKGTDLSFYGPGLLDQVAAELNARPRKRHNFATPAETLERLLSEPGPVASTA